MIDSRLITGPPASGKSKAALDRFLSAPGSTLITPSATMAEHIRNELARAGIAVRPSRILTLAQFIEPLTDLAPAPPSVLHIMIVQALERFEPAQFQAVAQFSGVHQAIAELMEEVPAEDLNGEFARSLAPVFGDVKQRLAAIGLGLRNDRLRSARPVTKDPIVLDGFFSFAPAELDLIEALAARSPVTITLPDWPGSAAARERLLQAGFVEQRMGTALRSPRREVVASPFLGYEVEEIVRRILEYASRGRAFREMGIILRTRDPYVAALETTLARFGIPARFHFTDPLSSHPAIQYLSGIVRALLGGWDHEALLSLLRMPVSGLGATPEGDRLDFEIRKNLPGSGLSIPAFEIFEPTEKWLRHRLDAKDWAARLKTLHALLPIPEIKDQCDRDQAQIWRSTAAALAGFDESLDTVAQSLGSGSMSLPEFWRHAETALSLDQLRVPNRRHNVVNIFDVYESRQWELPIVFVCGLNERVFPQYHSENPLMSDAARRRAGLRTSTDRQLEEGFLFELATTRATEELVLSYSRFTEKGDDALRSIFLGDAKAELRDSRVRPQAKYAASPVMPASAIDDPALRNRLRIEHKSLAPTSIETFLQCPFQFFAAKTLRLRERPLKPRDRLDVRLQGSILHKALAEYSRSPLLGVAWLDTVFDDECRRERVPRTYRTEAVRLELFRHFEGFLADHAYKLLWDTLVEQDFNFPLTPRLVIKGRIDRIDVSSTKQAIVIDYKYSAENKISERVEEHESGNLVQGGLYLIAAERAFQLEPAGMLYCGLRKKVSWDGWHVPIDGLDQGESRTPSALRELMDASAQKGIETFETILSGRIAPNPADLKKCQWCDFRDICRNESQEAERAAEAGGA